MPLLCKDFLTDITTILHHAALYYRCVESLTLFTNLHEIVKGGEIQIFGLAYNFELHQLYSRKDRMPLNIVQTLRSKSAGDAARLIGTMGNFITDTGLINTMNQFNLNDKKGDARLVLQVEAFAGIAGLKAQVDTWLKS